MKLDIHPRDCIGRKIMKSNRLIGQIYRKYISPFGLSNSQMTIVFMIAQIEGVNQTRLSEMLAMEKSTVSRNLRRLILNELVYKKDRTHLVLTSKGRTLVKNVLPEWKKAMKESRAILGISGEQAVSLVLSKLVK